MRFLNFYAVENTLVAIVQEKRNGQKYTQNTCGEQIG
jgi:hypothetical protein